VAFFGYFFCPYKKSDLPKAMCARQGRRKCSLKATRKESFKPPLEATRKKHFKTRPEGKETKLKQKK
jgi:hypothetical protein